MAEASTPVASGAISYNIDLWTFTTYSGQATAYDSGFVACRMWERPASIAQWAKRGARKPSPERNALR